MKYRAHHQSGRTNTATMKPKPLSVPRIGLLFEEASGLRYQRHVDTAAPEQSHGEPVEPRPGDRGLFGVLLPGGSLYEPLEEEEEEEEDNKHRLKQEKKVKKKEKYKKYKKNVGKAIRYSWKCLMLGLQNFTVGYSTPFSAASSIIPDFHPGGAWG